MCQAIAWPTTLIVSFRIYFEISYWTLLNLINKEILKQVQDDNFIYELLLSFCYLISLFAIIFVEGKPYI